MSEKKQQTVRNARDKLREVMVRDRGEMRQELRQTEGERDRELQEAARRASSGELDGGERAARTAQEVFADPAEMKSLANDLENQLCVEQERGQAREDLPPS